MNNALLCLGWRLSRMLRTAGKASSFADPADVNAFRLCKLHGGSDAQCFKVGDNGRGCWNDDTSQHSGISCAIPPDDMIAQWGSIGNARHKKVRVWANGHSIVCVLKDRLPWKKFILHGVVIDLNPDACRAVDLAPPLMVDAQWAWVSG